MGRILLFEWHPQNGVIARSAWYRSMLESTIFDITTWRSNFEHMTFWSLNRAANHSTIGPPTALLQLRRIWKWFSFLISSKREHTNANRLWNISNYTKFVNWEQLAKVRVDFFFDLETDFLHNEVSFLLRESFSLLEWFSFVLISTFGRGSTFFKTQKED